MCQNGDPETGLGGMRPPLERMRIRSRGQTDAGALRNIFGEGVRHYADGRPRPHAGWDLVASLGTPVFAIARGEIADVRYSESYGRVIALQFSHEGMVYYAFYAHLLSALVQLGQAVEEGEWIGMSGSSGKSAEGEDPHLHFEIRYVPFLPGGLGTKGRVDPALFFGQYLVCR